MERDPTQRAKIAKDYDILRRRGSPVAVIKVRGAGAELARQGGGRAAPLNADLDGRSCRCPALPSTCRTPQVYPGQVYKTYFSDRHPTNITTCETWGWAGLHGEGAA